MNKDHVTTIASYAYYLKDFGNTIEIVLEGNKVLVIGIRKDKKSLYTKIIEYDS